MKKKTICVAMLLSLLVLLLAGCGETDQSRYENAQSLMAKGQFAEAAAKFDKLGSYEDFAKLSMYCKAARSMAAAIISYASRMATNEKEP